MKVSRVSAKIIEIVFSFQIHRGKNGKRKTNQPKRRQERGEKETENNEIL